MSIKQLSVFLENKHGTLIEVTELLATSKIDMRAMSVADTTDFGILRLIVNDPEKARGILTDAGFIASINDVLAVEIPDSPGALSEVIRSLSGDGINIEYLYAFLTTKKDNAYVVLRVADNGAATAVLAKNGVRSIGEDEIKQL